MTHRGSFKKNSHPDAKKRKPFPVRHVVAYKAGLADELAERLMESPAYLVDESTGEVKDHPARYYAGLLAAEGAGNNHVVAELVKPEYELDPETGELLDATYTQGIPLSRHSLRISPAYSQALRRRAHHVAELAVVRAQDELAHRRTPKGISESWGFKTKKNWSYRWVHGVFTMQHGPGARTFEEVQRINRAWELFRKRKIYTDNVVACIKGVEGKVKPGGAHVHAHCLMLMRRVDSDAWDRAWRECLGAAGWCRLMTIRPSGKVQDPEHEETQAKALAELTKYITKTEDLLNPDEDGQVVGWEVLVALCDAERWPRMFETLGTARPPRKGADDPENPMGASVDSLPRSGSFRFIRREYLTAEPLPLPTAEAWDDLADGPAPGKWEYFGRERADGPPRAPTWRQLMRIMSLDKWLIIMAARQDRAQEWRLGQICARSRGDVIDLDGNIRKPRPKGRPYES